MVVATLALLLSAPAVASADPEVPQPGTPCASDMTDAMTWPPDNKSPLECLDNHWQPSQLRNCPTTGG
jgi:hypothetical protein